MSESDDLISRKALRKEVTEKVHFMTVDGHIAYDKTLKLIDSAPTVDLADRPQGEWIEHSVENLLWGHNECPFCHMRSNRGAHYCQYCGAAMRKGGAE